MVSSSASHLEKQPIAFITIVYFSPLALLALLVSTLVSLSSSEDTCGAEKQVVCDSLFRNCEVTFDGTTEQCSNVCIKGYIGYDRETIIEEYLDRTVNLEQTATCIAIDTIDLVALEKFKDEFGPQYRARSDELGSRRTMRMLLGCQHRRFFGRPCGYQCHGARPKLLSELESSAAR
jgi:hypothetical protein